MITCLNKVDEIDKFIKLNLFTYLVLHTYWRKWRIVEVWVLAQLGQVFLQTKA